MRPLEEVRAEVIGSMTVLGSESVGFRDATGRVLAEPVTSDEDVPQFANSAMDGFAVRADDVAEPGAVLLVVDDVPAGQVASVAVGPGEAIKIMTGAPMPEGADTIVRVEDTESDDDKVRVTVAVPHGTSVRPPGGDIGAGDTVFGPGVRLTPMHVGVLATLGVVEPMVHKKPRVALMSTGDELQPPETVDLGPGMIRDSNRPMLHAMLNEAGADVIDIGRVSDDPDELRAAIGNAAVQADVIVSSGGVSMGEHDVTKLVLREVGIDFMQVAIKPAKPFAFGHLGGKPFFGLPGNPVSAMVSFEQFVRPALLTMQGATSVLRPAAVAIAGEDLETDPRKTVFLRVNIVGDYDKPVVIRSGGQESNVLSAAANADAFAVVPRGVETIEEGEAVLLEMFQSPETRGLSNGF